MAGRLLIVWTLACGLAGAGGARPVAWLPPIVEKSDGATSKPAPPAAAEVWVAPNEALPVPEGARVSLSLDKPRYFLGENILLHYVLENRGDQPFAISMGSDYRGASRALRFKVTATGEDGEAVADPDPSGMCFGGIGWRPKLEPGEKHWHSLPLVRYCRFEKPGTYTIRVTHDLGWREAKGRKIPVGETRIRLVMPTAQQARAVVDEMYRLPTDPNRTAGKRAAPYADFLALRHPIYLPILLKRARAGCEQAVTAIGQIPSPEATEALIELLAHGNGAFAVAVARHLQKRLPIPPQPWLDSAWFRRAMAPRRYLVASSWRPEFGPRVRAAAKGLLARARGEALSWAAVLLGEIGRDEDLPALIRELDSMAVQHRPAPDKEPTAQEWRTDPRRVRETLLRAVVAVARRGIHVPLEPRTPGEGLVLATAIGLSKNFRPKGWERPYAKLLGHEFPFCRETALKNLPMPAPEPLVKLVAERLEDPDVHVLTAACHAADRLKAPQLKGPVLKVLRKARSRRLLSEAQSAAYQLGARVDRIQILASRLDEDKETASQCLRFLVGIVEGTSGWGSSGAGTLDERRALKARWLRFVRDHREAIAAGRRFRIGDSALTPDLFPKGFTFHRQGLPDWP